MLHLLLSVMFVDYYATMDDIMYQFPTTFGDGMKLSHLHLVSQTCWRSPWT